MKKTLAILLILMMMLGALAACGEKAKTEPNPQEPTEVTDGTPAAEPIEAETSEDTLHLYDFFGTWQDETSQRAMMTIAPATSYGDAAVKIHWGSSAFEAAEWTMYAAFDAQTGSLNYSEGSMAIVTAAEDGTLTADEQWSGSEGAFTLDEDGKLLWTDSKEERSAEMRFVRLPAAPLTEEQFTDEYFHVIGGYAVGTAGSSIAMAKAACDAMQFAERHDLLAQDVDAMRDVMLRAWESLPQEEQTAFDENFMDVTALLDSAMEEYAELPGVFEDAGVRAQMQELVNSDYARGCWSVLCANTLTMGNSEG